MVREEYEGPAEGGFTKRLITPPRRDESRKVTLAGPDRDSFLKKNQIKILNLLVHV